jgi:hypothetical protein
VTNKCSNRSLLINEILPDCSDFNLFSLTFPLWQALHLFFSLGLDFSHVKDVPAGQFSQSALSPSSCPLGQHIFAEVFDHVPLGQFLHTLSNVR